MPIPWHRACWISCLALLVAASAGRAEPAPDPLRLVPGQADLVIKVEQPGKLAQIVTTHDLIKQLYSLEAFREQLDSTSSRRFFQLVSYFEKQLGTEWPGLLDRLASGGAVLALQIGTDPAPALFVIQGKDEKLLQKFKDLALVVIEQELARQDSKDKVEKGTYRKLETVKVGQDFHAAIAGTALLISNKEEVLHQSMDLALDGSIRSMAGLIAVADAKKLLPPKPMAWVWLNLESVLKQARDTLDALQANPVVNAVAGHLLSMVRSSPYACAGIYEEKDGFSATIRLPSGRDAIPSHLATGHLPPLDQGGTLPPLEPEGVLLSTSFYLDLAEFWKNRAKFLSEEQLAQLDEFDKASAAVLGGHTIGELLAMSGSQHRLVVANQKSTGYKIAPGQRLPTFAFVTTQRDPQFGKTMEAVLRAGAIAVGPQLKLKLVEEKHGDVTIVGYRFPENGVLPQDQQKLRFNYSPCFATVGDQFVVAASLELCHELVDVLQKEANTAGSRKVTPVASRSRLYGRGGAEALKQFENQLLAQTVLDRAVPPDDAKLEVQALLDLVRRLGTLEWQTNYTRQEFHFDVRWKLSK